MKGYARAMVSVLLPAAWLVLPAACGPLELGEVSPLAGTWRGISTGTGSSLVGEVVFDYAGDLVRLEVITSERILEYVFDGQPRSGSDGQSYVATARTTLEDGSFEVNGFIEYNDGRYEGVTYVTIEGTVRFGSIDGRVRIAFPGAAAFSSDFAASRS